VPILIASTLLGLGRDGPMLVVVAFTGDRVIMAAP
jgi:hypothetical protein